MAHLSRFQIIEHIASSAFEGALQSTFALLSPSNCLPPNRQGNLCNVIALEACSHGRKRPVAAIRRHCTKGQIWGKTAMTIPMEFQHASEDFEAFLQDAYAATSMRRL
jgi:hypothetical protein